MPTSVVAEPPPSDVITARDPYRGVVLTLLALLFAGTVGAAAAGLMLGNQILLHAAITLGMSAGALLGVAVAQSLRAAPALTVSPIPAGLDPSGLSSLPAAAERLDQVKGTEASDRPGGPSADAQRHPRSLPSPRSLIDRFEVAARVTDLRKRARELFPTSGELRNIGIVTAIAGGIASLLALRLATDPAVPTTFLAGAGVIVSLAGAGLAITAGRYLAEIDPSQLPEAPALVRGARVLAWIMGIAAAAVVLQWLEQPQVLRVLAFSVLAVNASLCYGLLVSRAAPAGAAVFPLDIGALSTLGSRPNALASVLDAAERQLGIDLRSTWALTVVRRTIEPMLVALCAVGWLSTSLTVVGVDEEGLVERLGVPVKAAPLLPGLHVHWPAPIDRVIRISVQRVQVLTVGHEGAEEASGPENVLWARQHAANEYTLLLGNGRDLITVDAAVQFRVADPKAWRYHTQNPADALRAIAHRAVMRTTVDRTLAEALSENLVALTARMRTMVQTEADALGLGVEVLGFTVGGMHPPVMVAGDYEAVVSAELGKVTAVVNAQAFRNRTVPYAETAALRDVQSAQAEGAQLLGRAAGEAWSFLTLQAQHGVAPDEYFFRRRLETLEAGLARRRFTILDARFQRDGGELWMTP